MNVIEAIVVVAAIVVGCFVLLRKHEKIFAAYTPGGFALLMLVMVTAIIVYLLLVGTDHAYYIGMAFVCYLYFFVIAELLPDRILAKRYMKEHGEETSSKRHAKRE